MAIMAGVSCIIAGFDSTSSKPKVYRTDPGGAVSEWLAVAVGRGSEKALQALELELRPRKEKSTVEAGEAQAAEFADRDSSELLARTAARCVAEYTGFALSIAARGTADTVHVVTS
jgi:20S proteasome alpha/beta subunit